MKRKIAIFLLFFLFSALFSYEQKFFILPSESKQALNSVLKELKLAKKEIKISIYNFTHKKIAKTLKNIAKKGIKVKIIFDYESSKKRKTKSMLYYLAKYKNIECYQIRGKYVKKKDYFAKMHQKIVVIDNKVLIFGSANWSYSGFGKNYEVVFILKDPKIARKYSIFFDNLIKKATKY